VRSMAFVTLFVSLLINLLLRVRVPARKSGPLADLRAFTELPYVFFVIGFFFVYWAVYFAFYYVRITPSVVHFLLLIWMKDRQLRLQICLFHFPGFYKPPTLDQCPRYSRSYSSRFHRCALSRPVEYRTADSCVCRHYPVLLARSCAYPRFAICLRRGLRVHG
jgi:hypothetical protein